MDPVTGISLTASVIHLVSFGLHTITAIREVYVQGSIGKYDDVEHKANILTNLTQSLQQSLRGSSIPRSSALLSKEEEDLKDLGHKCEDCAHRLQHELGKLHSQPRSSVLSATKGVARAVWKKNKIEEIGRQLEAYRSTLETSLLYRLSQRFETQNLRTNQSFASLDGSLQHIVRCLADSQTSLATLVGQEAKDIRSHTTTQFRRLEQLHVDDRLYDELTKSLFYPEIFSRQEQVDSMFDGIEDSYRWIFQTPSTRKVGKRDRNIGTGVVPLWDDFAVWLRSGQGMYWVQGKAGAGKSTLMNYLCKHDASTEFLKEWCMDRLLLTPAYFFWAAGSKQQKSIHGLLRSLIYQLLTQCRELVGCLKRQNEPLHAWTESRLFSTLLGILQQSQVPLAICMFIDGLDEFDGPYESVVTILTKLANQGNFKICFSSRPLLLFEKAFDAMPGLKLQDLTYDSIRHYAESRLHDSLQERVSDNEPGRHQAEYLVDTIVERAEGVFLWAVIAVRDARAGLQDLVELDELVETIDSLPSELEELFMLMLNRIKPAYQRNAARFLQITLHTTLGAPDYGVWRTDRLTLCRLYFIHLQRDFDDRPFSHDKFATSDVAEACRTMRIQLLSHTAGLLELTPKHAPSDDDESEDDESDDLLAHEEPILSTKVAFLHRTARDFLTENEKAKSFLARKGYTMAQVHLAFAKGALAEVAQFSGQKRSRIAYNVFLAAMQHISYTERLVGVPQSHLMQSLVEESYLVRYTTAQDVQARFLDDAFKEPALMVDENGVLIDVVAIAAKVDMVLYIREQLGISSMSRNPVPDLPRPANACVKRKTLVQLRSTRPSYSDGSVGKQAHKLDSSSYRQTLRKYFRAYFDPVHQSSSEISHPDTEGDVAQTVSELTIDTLAETYLLSCCNTSCHETVRTLLHAGANPMVKFISDLKFHPHAKLHCFWGFWLRHIGISFKNRRSGRLRFDEETSGPNLTATTDYNTTKTLLAYGADYDMSVGSILDTLYIFSQPSGLVLSIRAMFILEQRFNNEPDFRNFAAEVRSLGSKSTREFLSIAPSRNDGNSKRLPSVSLSPGECDTLWPLVERWESTFHRGDREAFKSGMERIWKAHQSHDIAEAEDRLLPDN
ncbi:MAG: hypothetical protein Q9218_005229 [Villophora microphyllina]